MSAYQSASLSHLKWVLGSCVAWSGFGAGLLWWYVPAATPLPEPAVVSEPVSAPSVEISEDVVIPDRLGRGETLSTVLERNGFYGDEQRNLIEALGEHLPLRKLRAGNEIEFRYAADSGEPTVWFERGADRVVRAKRSAAGWRADVVERELETRLVTRWGVLKGNLFDSMAALGESAPLVIAFANVLQWDFDFHSQSQPGDRFGVVVEKKYLEDELVGYGELKAVVYQSARRELAAVRFSGPDDQAEYYDLNGTSMRKAFLRAPLEFQRISSGYSSGRLHPVDGKRRPHLAVDYAAKTGTPVHSVADGVVTFRGRNGGAGNMVSVRHRHGYVSSYLHLSRYARGLAKGDRVKQKQLIGYVGMTGTATGPHLDFRLKKNGRSVNPLDQIFPPGPPVPAAYRTAFERQRDVLMSRLGLDAPQAGGDRSVESVPVTADPTSAPGAQPGAAHYREAGR